MADKRVSNLESIESYGRKFEKREERKKRYVAPLLSPKKEWIVVYGNGEQMAVSGSHFSKRMIKVELLYLSSVRDWLKSVKNRGKFYRV